MHYDIADYFQLAKIQYDRRTTVVPYSAFAAITDANSQKSTPLKKGSKKMDDNSADDFGYYLPTDSKAESISQIADRKRRAKTSNPPGVRIVDYPISDIQIWAGYLYFKDTRQSRNWIDKACKSVIEHS